MPIDSFSTTAALRRGLTSGGDSNARRDSDGWFLATIAAIAVCALVTLALQVDPLGDSTKIGILAQLALMCVGLLIARALIGSIHALSAIAFVTYSQAVLFVARPLYQMQWGDSLSAFSGERYGDSFIAAEAITGVGFVAICSGYGWALRRRRESFPLRLVQPWSPTAFARVRPAIVLVVLAGIALYAIYVLQTGVGAYLSGVSAGRSEEARAAAASSSAYFYSGLQFALGALILLLLQNRLARNRIGQLWAISLLALAMLPQLLAGNRSVFVPVAVSILLIFASTNPKVISFSRVAVLLPLAFVLGIVAPRIWRDSLSRGGSVDMAIQSAFSLETAIGDFVGGLDTAMIDAFEVQVRAQDSGALPLLFGQSYLSALTAVVPRQLWPEKPEVVDAYLNSVLFPQTHELGIGFAFGVYSEPYLNFGLLGVVVIGLIFGLILGFATRWVTESATMLPAFWLVMLTSFIFPLMRGSLTFDAQRLLIPALPVVVAIGFFAVISGTDGRQDSTGGRRGRRRGLPGKSPHLRTTGERP
jgi:oligosaccharide repeat unit polymerase